MNRRDLPIFELEHAIVSAFREHSRVVLQAPTGSGKSTQVPQIVFDHGLARDGEIVVLQPRRLATRMLAARVAQERNVPRAFANAIYTETLRSHALWIFRKKAAPI